MVEADATHPDKGAVDFSAGAPEAEAGRVGQAEFRPGTRLGFAVVSSIVTRRGRCVLYRAIDSRSGEDLVVKALHPFPLGSDKDRARFDREARLASSLSHPNLLRASSRGEHEGSTYFSSRYLARQTLARALFETAGPVDFDRARRWLRQLCDALQYLHTRTIIHRELSPSAVLLGQGPLGPSVRLTDFGLTFDSNTRQRDRRPTEVVESGYMAPELLRGEAPGPKADVYSMGRIAEATLLSRRSPGEHRRTPHPTTQGPADAPRRSPTTRLPASMVEMVERMLSAEAADRPPLASFAAAMTAMG
jgi:serine/threonine protein kinase